MSPASMNNKQVAQILEDIALLLEIQGENPFKTRAYSNGARLISGLDRDVAELVASGEIRALKGIGPALSEKITELVTTGRLDYYERLKAAVPVGLLELLQVPQLGPKKIKAVHEQLGVTSLGELEYACLENRLIDLPGFGKKTQETILKGIAQLKKNRGQFLLGDVLTSAEELVEKLRRVPGVEEASLAGSVRRRREIVRDIDCVVSSACSEEVREAIRRWPDLGNPELPGGGKACGQWEVGIPVEIQVVPGASYPFALLYGTGSSEHREALARHASLKGFSLADRGLSQSGKEVTCRSEEEIYGALGLSWIVPELREGLGEIEAAARGELPDLLEEKDIRGVLHVHTDYSDGAVPIAEMAEAAQKLGYSYLGIADHSETARYAHGLDRERLRRQQEEIDRLNEAFENFVLLKGIELEILADGSLDYDEAVWKTCDFMVASVHAR
ncbi:MAG: PHP domain-containing protein, partial [Candidatus Tectomicrobia bacterium]|nr:PHP domain-containing protein [Candidatus Tectomicrobia bacterium]